MALTDHQTGQDDIVSLSFGGATADLVHALPALKGDGLRAWRVVGHEDPPSVGVDTVFGLWGGLLRGLGGPLG